MSCTIYISVLAGEFFKEINPNNPLGYAGILAKQFQRLLGQIWVKGDPIINPIAIKHLLYEKTKAFSGYGQQDAHEFMNYFMDGIHEVMQGNQYLGFVFGSDLRVLSTS